MSKPKFYHEKIPNLKKLKHIFKKLKYKKLNLWPGMAPYAYYYQHYKSMGNLVFQGLRILKFLFFIEKYKIKGQGKEKIMVSFLIDRKDHHKRWISSLKSFKKEELIILDAFQKGERNFQSIKKRFIFKFPNLFKIYKIWKFLKQQKLKSTIIQKIDYLYFILLVYFQFRKIDYLSQIIKNYLPKAYIAYSGYRNNDEIILTQLCKNQKIKTFTMQNYNLSEFKNFDYESVTYENFISDYFLVWGGAGKKVLKKFINNKKILIVGNPNYGKIKKTRKKEFNPKICTVFLSHFNYEESNFKLIEIIKKFAKENPKIKFRFNIHLDNDRKKYINKLNSKNLEILKIHSGKEQLVKLFKESDFIIVHNTTIALESLEFSSPILQYFDKRTIKFDIPNFAFKNEKELKKIFIKLLNKKQYRKISQLNFKAYKNNFFQPKISIPEYYKKTINSKIS